jgi:hypothetical protein
MLVVESMGGHAPWIRACEVMPVTPVHIDKMCCQVPQTTTVKYSK